MCIIRTGMVNLISVCDIRINVFMNIDNRSWNDGDRTDRMDPDPDFGELAEAGQNRSGWRRRRSRD